jgi:hypothetical protein
MRRALLAAALIVAAAAIAFTRAVGTDYGNLDCGLRLPYCDDAKPLIDSLAHGHVGALATEQTLLGPVSILLRWPFALVGRVFGYGDRLVYDLGVLGCLLALAAAAWLVADEMRRRGRPEWLQWLVALGIVVNPLTFRVAFFGHPEEAVGAAACLAGAVAAGRAHARATGALAAAAVATKLWGVLALAPLMLALPPRLWARATAAAGIGLLVLYGPLAAGAPDRFYHAIRSGNDLGTIPGTAQASNLWWFLMDPAPFDRAAAVVGGQVVFQHENGWVLGPPWGDIAHPLVIVLALAAALAFLLPRRPRGAGVDVLLLLSAIFLMRCLLDPNNFSYYHLPFLVCLIAWEGIARGFPWRGLVSALALWAIITISPHVHSDAGFVWLYLAWALPLLGLLALTLGMPRARRAESVDVLHQVA